MADYKDPRGKGRKAIEESVPKDVWEKNKRFSQHLRALLAKHPIGTHPLIEFLENETLTKEKSLIAHLEFGHGFAQIFTDAVLQAMFLAKDLEPTIGPKGKASARFLWAINLMDELGYIPSNDSENYAGNPYQAHYYLYMEMFDDLDSNQRALIDYKATAPTKAARATFEDHYDCYKKLTAVLALSESIFDKFAGAWADNVDRSTEIDTSTGYHTIHVEDHDGDSIDDEHSEDGWTLFCQAITPDDHEEIEKKVNEWIDTWYKFADHMLEQLAS